MNMSQAHPTMLATVPSQSAASAKRIALNLARELSWVTEELGRLAETHLNEDNEFDSSRRDEVLDTLKNAQETLEEFQKYFEADFLAPGSGMAHAVSDEDRLTLRRRQESLFEDNAVSQSTNRMFGSEEEDG